MDNNFPNLDENTVFLTVPGKAGRTLKPGDVVGNDYSLIELIGSGGMGVVYRCRHLIMGTDYALKILRPDQVNEKTWQRFEVEGKTIAKLEHPNIVKIFNMGVYDKECPYYVMELLQGYTLKSLVTTRGPMAVDQALDIFYQLASGLGYAHSKGIVHRDIKPSNIVLQKESGGRYMAKIVDFGLAKLVDRHTFAGQSLTSAGEVFGSPLFMSPEQGEGTEIDARADIYSLGCTLFKTLTDKPPFFSENPLQIILMKQQQPPPSLESALPGQAFPQALEDMLQKMLATRPEDRYQSMEQLGQDIRRVQQGKGLAIAGPNKLELTPPLNPVEEKHSSLAGLWPRLAIAFLLLITSAFATTFYCIYRSHSSTTPGASPKQSNVTTGATAGPAGTMEKGSPVTDKGMEKAKADFASFKPKVTKLIKGRGQDLLEFYFPETAVGEIENGVGARAQARRTVTLQSIHPISLAIRRAVHGCTWANPWILKKIDPNEINDLTLDQLNDTSMAPGQLDSDSSGEKSILDMLAIASNWRNLHGLDISACTLSPRIVEALGSLPHLKRLTIKDCDPDGTDPAQFSFWGKLSDLDLAGLKDVDPVIMALSGSKNLRNLNLDRTSPTAAAIAELSRCPNLQGLSLEKTKLSDSQLLALSRLPQLKVLWLRQVNIAPEKLIKLDGLKHLNRLHVTADGWSRAQVVGTTMALPNCDLATNNWPHTLE